MGRPFAFSPFAVYLMPSSRASIVRVWLFGGTRPVFGLVQVELPGADIAVSSPRDYGESQHRQYDAGGEKKSVGHVLAPLCRDYTAWGGGEGPCLLAGADFRCRGCGRGRGEVSDEDAEADDSGLHELVEHACCG